MIFGNSISELLKTLACFAFAVALVLFPPSASHAATGMHGDHQSMSASVNHAAKDHDHTAAPTHLSHDKHGHDAGTHDADHATDHCCNGICVIAVMHEDTHVFANQPASGRYLALDAQTTSVEPSDFLRPPQLLI